MALHTQRWKTHRQKGGAIPRFPTRWKEMFDRYHCTRREVDSCLLDIARHPKHHESYQMVFFNVSRSANIMSHKCGAGPTILPSGKMLISYNDVARPLFGVEALALQGIHASMLPIVTQLLKHSFDSRFLRHAAGNAFSSPQSQLGLVISLCVFLNSLVATLKSKLAGRLHVRG